MPSWEMEMCIPEALGPANLAYTAVSERLSETQWKEVVLASKLMDAPALTYIHTQRCF